MGRRKTKRAEERVPYSENVLTKRKTLERGKFKSL